MPDKHMRSGYIRYHREVYWPDIVADAAEDFLPIAATHLPLSHHYMELARGLPDNVFMPKEYNIIEATLVKDTLAVFRVMIRFLWSRADTRKGRKSDLVLILEGDYQILTGFWRSYGDDIPKDTAVYVHKEEHVRSYSQDKEQPAYTTCVSP